MKKYYYTNEQNQKTGPVSYTALSNLHQQGVINSNTAVMAEGDDAWTPYKDYTFAEAGAPDNSGAVAVQPKKSYCATWAIVGIGSVVVGGFLIVVLIVLMLQQLGADVQSVFNNAQTKLASESSHTLLNNLNEAKRVLGEDIAVTEVPGHQLVYDIPTRTATGTLNVKGSKASGILNVIRVQNKGSKEGKFTKLDLVVDGKTYDLLKPAGAESR